MNTVKLPLYAEIVAVILSCHLAALGDEREPAKLTLQTEPSGATVRIDDEVVGVTPLRAQTVNARGRWLKISKDGFVTRQVQLPDELKDPLNLNTLRLAKQGAVISVWRVGRRQQALPQVEVAKRLEEQIHKLGFGLRIEAFSAADFPVQFRQAAIQDKGAHLPDVIIPSGDIRPILEIQRDKKLAPLLRPTMGPWTFGEMPLAYLIAGSNAEAAAEYVALADLPYCWRTTIDEEKLKNLPGQLKPDSARRMLESVNRQATIAYLTQQMERIDSLIHDEMLPLSGGQYGDPTAGGTVVTAVRPIYILGNTRLAFVLSWASCIRKGSVGGHPLLSIWSKPKENWKLLTITDDPVSTQLALQDLPAVAAKLKPGPAQPLKPAKIVSPPDGVFPIAPAGKRFGDFVWEPRRTEDVVLELAEFNYRRAARLMGTQQGAISTGKLWTTHEGWKWRVWTINQQGQIAFSETRHFFK